MFLFKDKAYTMSEVTMSNKGSNSPGPLEDLERIEVANLDGLVCQFVARDGIGRAHDEEGL